jgi:hypothetical protein
MVRYAGGINVAECKVVIYFLIFCKRTRKKELNMPTQRIRPRRTCDDRTEETSSRSYMCACVYVYVRECTFNCRTVYCVHHCSRIIGPLHNVKGAKHDARPEKQASFLHLILAAYHTFDCATKFASATAVPEIGNTLALHHAWLQ